MFSAPLVVSVTLAGLAALTILAGAASVETCLSPYIKGLRQPEKVLYLWTLPVGNRPDYLSVIDVNVASPTYGTILKKVEVGSTGNEAHHMGFTDDRTKIWAASLNTSRFFIFDVAADPLNPRLIRTIDEVPKLTGFSGPHTPYAIPGRMLVSMASGLDGTGPGGLAEFTNEGEFVASHKAPNHPYETVVKPEFNRMITSSWVPQKTFMSPLPRGGFGAPWPPSRGSCRPLRRRATVGARWARGELGDGGRGRGARETCLAFPTFTWTSRIWPTRRRRAGRHESSSRPGSM
jgi:56kDa selenium binding protein (SBP56)